MAGTLSAGASTRQRRRPATTAVHGGFHPDPQSGALAAPLVSSSNFVHGNPGGYQYAREGSPAFAALEALLTELEGGAACVSFGSGMAAISAAVALVPSGAFVVGASHAYSGTRRLLRELDAGGRLRARFVDITDTEAVSQAVEGAALLCLETITNPLLGVPALRDCIDAAHRAGALVMVDSTLTTPLACRPLELGADISVHSLTKYAGGHSDLLLGGAIVADAGLGDRLRSQRAMTGGIPGALESWLCLRGMRTLDVRVQRQMASAAELARRLEAHPSIERSLHPALTSHPQHERAALQFDDDLLGAIVSMVPSGGADAAEEICASTRLYTHATSLGGVESTLERRARYALDAEVCPPGLIRISVGIEHVEDLWDDLSAAIG